jgi:hypothetical protein
MEHADDVTTLPLVDEPTVKDVFAEFCTGLNFVHGCAGRPARSRWCKSTAMKA